MTNDREDTATDGGVVHTAPNWQPIQKDEKPDTAARVPCECGETVTKQFARVLSPTDDSVEHCPECSSFREIAGMHEHIGDGVGKKGR